VADVVEVCERKREALAELGERGYGLCMMRGLTQHGRRRVARRRTWIAEELAGGAVVVESDGEERREGGSSAREAAKCADAVTCLVRLFPSLSSVSLLVHAWQAVLHPSCLLRCYWAYPSVRLSRARIAPDASCAARRPRPCRSSRALHDASSSRAPADIMSTLDAERFTQSLAALGSQPGLLSALSRLPLLSVAIATSASRASSTTKVSSSLARSIHVGLSTLCVRDASVRIHRRDTPQ
jgi:hypothetical protein